MKIHRVFVSSVMQGYADRRATARQALQDLGIEAVLAETLPAQGTTPRADIMEHIDKCDALLGIYGLRYGWDGSQSGLSPTEEEYWQARDHWKPIFAFIDRMESGKMDQKQRDFLDEVQNWDTGVMRNEFRSVAELSQKIKAALTGSCHSPRYQAFVAGCSTFGPKTGLSPALETRLPAFDLLLYGAPSGAHLGLDYDPHKLLAIVDGDAYDAAQIRQTVTLWKQTMVGKYKPAITHPIKLEACLAIAVENNPHGLSLAVLPWERPLSFGGYYGVLVDLKRCQIDHSPMKPRDRGVELLFLSPVVRPALYGVCKPVAERHDRR